jgi:hypothetical protein
MERCRAFFAPSRCSLQNVARFVTQFRNSRPNLPQVRIQQRLQAQIVPIQGQVVSELQPASAFFNAAERTAETSHRIRSTPAGWARQFEFLQFRREKIVGLSRFTLFMESPRPVFPGVRKFRPPFCRDSRDGRRRFPVFQSRKTLPPDPRHVRKWITRRHRTPISPSSTIILRKKKDRDLTCIPPDPR